MVLRIPQGQADALGFDLAAAVMAFIDARREHASTIDKPAPSAPAIVEEIVLRHAGAFEIVDDRTPSDRRYDLTRRVVQIAQERANAVLSPARQNLAILDMQIIGSKPEEERDSAEAVTFDAAKLALERIGEIQRHAAALVVEIDELTDANLGSWLPSGWPAG